MFLLATWPLKMTIAQHRRPQATIGRTLQQSLEDSQGRSIPISELARGRKATVLVFWATWCLPCRVELPLLQGLQSRYSDRDLGLFLISGESPDRSLRYLRSEGITLTALTDVEDSVRRWVGVEAIPTAVLLEPDARVREIIVGVRPVELENAIRAVLNR